jgi:hypothetical protein
VQPQGNESYTDQRATQQICATPAITALKRTQLSLEQKTMLCASALARFNKHGAKSELCGQYEVSRPTVYSAMQTACEVLGTHFEQQDAKTVMVEVNETQLRRTVVALRVMAPNALRPIEQLLPIIYPGVYLSYGKVQQITSQAEQLAAELNATMDMSKIEAAALDEMYSQGQPVLAAVDLDTGALFALELRQSRAADDWAEVLNQCNKQGLDLHTVVKDAARGIESGVQQVYPQAQQRDDCFHALYEMGKVKRILQQRAYGAIGREEQARQNLQKLRSSGRGEKRSKLVGELAMATRRCQQAIQLYDNFEQAMHMAQEAMQIVDVQQGRLRTAEQSQAGIEHAACIMMGLDDYPSPAKK